MFSLMRKDEFQIGDIIDVDRSKSIISFNFEPDASTSESPLLIIDILHIDGLIFCKVLTAKGKIIFVDSTFLSSIEE